MSYIQEAVEETGVDSVVETTTPPEFLEPAAVRHVSLHTVEVDADVTCLGVSPQTAISLAHGLRLHDGPPEREGTSRPPVSIAEAEGVGDDATNEADTLPRPAPLPYA